MPGVRIRQFAGKRAVLGLLVGFGLLALAALPSLLLGVLAVPMGADLGFDASGLGVTLAAFWAATSASAPFGGMLADRWTWPRTALLGASVSTLSLAATGLFATTFPTLVAMMIIAGIGLGISSPTSNVVLLSEVPGPYLGQAFGIKQSATPAMSVIAGLSVPLATIIGWRAVYLLGMTAFPALLLLMRRSVRAQPLRDPGSAPTTRSANHHEVRRIPLLWTSLVTVLGTFVLTVLAGFSVVSLVDSGLSLDVSGLIFAAASALALSIRVGAGWWLDRRARLDLLPVIWLFAGSIVGLLLITAGLPVTVTIGTGIAIACSLGWPPILILLVVQSNPHAPARSSGINAIGSGVGSIIGPITFAFLYEITGLPSAWLMTTAVAAIAVVIAWFAQTRTTSPSIANVPE